MISDSDRFILSALLNVHIQDSPNANAIASSHANKATPQFGFNKGIKEFGSDRWEETKSELKDNLMRMDSVIFMKQTK